MFTILILKNPDITSIISELYEEIITGSTITQISQKSGDMNLTASETSVTVSGLVHQEVPTRVHQRGELNRNERRS